MDTCKDKHKNTWVSLFSLSSTRTHGFLLFVFCAQTEITLIQKSPVQETSEMCFLQHRQSLRQHLKFFEWPICGQSLRQHLKFFNIGFFSVTTQTVAIKRCSQTLRHASKQQSQRLDVASSCTANEQIYNKLQSLN